ncbi:prostate and testis expressed protein 4 [Erinaceus europaeus]|uniref:Prostate and testis expressed protein 4 n=1 Tax=Erinaceus europaeus TaxID=9365 RepID=A0ABM3WGB6_ERIEU|nr:prostate and testis expressed protein 4 [Erinaceus europaeus]
MGPNMYRLLLLGIFTVLFMDEVIRYCNLCDYFDGFKCISGKKTCWKFNVLTYNRSCRTDHFYFGDRTTSKYLYRYSRASCKPCEEGMTQVFHDLIRETYCCNGDDFCNKPGEVPDITTLSEQDKEGNWIPDVENTHEGEDVIDVPSGSETD